MEFVCNKKPEGIIKMIETLVAKSRALCADVEFAAVDATRSEPEFLYRAIRAAIAGGRGYRDGMRFGGHDDALRVQQLCEGAVRERAGACERDARRQVLRRAVDGGGLRRFCGARRGRGG